MPHKIPQKALRAAVFEAVYFAVRDDRRLLGIPPQARDQIVTWAVNEAMGYERVVIDPSSLVVDETNTDVVLSAMVQALEAGQFARHTRLNAS